MSGRSAAEILARLVRDAGRLAVGRLGGEKSVHYKGKADVVTDVDLSVQRQILEVLGREFPTHAVLAEEGTAGHRGSAEYTWIVDPIDGTLNFARDIGFFCVSVALARGEDLLLGAIDDPVRRETFMARRGRGARLNGRPITVGGRSELERATIGYDMGYSEEGRRIMLQEVVQLLPSIQTFRVLGSAALGLAYTACGRLDAYIHQSLYPWDLAAARILIEEAGGVITDATGQACTLNCRTVLAANAVLHPLLLRALSQKP